MPAEGLHLSIGTPFRPGWVSAWGRLWVRGWTEPSMSVRGRGIGLVIVAVVGAARGQTCTPVWSGRFTTTVLSAPAGTGSLWVSSQAIYDDGSGPALYIAG